MTHNQQTVAAAPELTVGSAAQALPGVKFGGETGFLHEVRRRVDEYFRSSGRSQRDCLRMYLKTAIMLSGCAVFYVLLVFVADTWWEGLTLSLALGLSMGGVAFNVQHDGKHHAYSNREWVNRLMSMTLDLMGASSYMWHWKHNVYHHTYTNITGQDDDIDLGLLGRLTPHQKRLKMHRWQHFYLWPLYGFMTIKWQLSDDFYHLLVGRIGQGRFPRPKGWELAIFLGGKLTFFTLAFAIPMLLHPVWLVLLWYGVASWVLGGVMAVVFQLAHCVEEAEFPLPLTDTRRMEHCWAVHQIETTVDFARKSRVVSWLLGGLNFQIEHHLFPRICHVNYPAISRVVEETCREFGVRYSEHASVWSGLVSHFRWLRRMGSASA
jgi:linoleoyl-CoA desaturase